MLKLLEVLIAMALTYLLFAVLCSAVVEGLSARLKRRATFLRDGILRMLDGSNAPPRPNAADKNTAAATDEIGVLNHPWIVGMGQTADEFPSYVDARRFSDALLDRLLAPLGKDQPRVAQTAASTNAAYTELRDAVLARARTDPSAALLTPLFIEVDSTMDELRKRIEEWFNQQMDRVSGWYKRWAQRHMLIIGFLVAAAFNVDSIAMFHAYWTSAQLRETATSLATQIGDSGYSSEAGKKKMEEIRDKMLEARLPIGWAVEPDKDVDEFGQTVHDKLVDLGVTTLLATLACIVLKFAGLLLTAAAVVPGAQFWFDSMVQLLNIRSAGDKPGDEATQRPAAPTPPDGDEPAKKPKRSPS